MVTWAATENFTLYTTLGYLDANVDDPNPVAVAPLTPKWTASVSPQYIMPMDSGASMLFRVDWSFRDDMYGEPSSDPARFYPGMGTLFLELLADVICTTLANVEPEEQRRTA